MKYQTSRHKIFAWLPALFRRQITDAGLHGGCPVRKCRRDRQCSGPLVRNRGETLTLLAECEGLEAARTHQPDDLEVTLCWFSMTEAEQSRVASAYRSESIRLIKQADGTVTEATRTLRGRRWRECRLEVDPAEGPRDAAGPALRLTRRTQSPH